MVSVARALHAAGSMPFPGGLAIAHDGQAAAGVRSWTEMLQLRLGRLLSRDASVTDDVDPVADATPGTTQDATASARLEGIQLAAREIAHLVNNDLAVTVGTLDLLRSQEDLPPHARELLDRALAGISEAARRVHQLQHVQRIVTHETPAGPALDLDRSV